MNLDPANKHNSQWEVDRYLLCDPSFDRDAFEQRMLEDLSLAEQVASSVPGLQTIASAASSFAVSTSASAIKPQLVSKKPIVSSAKGRAGLVTAAAVLLAFSVWQLRKTPNDEQLAQIADSWVAIEGLTTAESLELVAAEEPSTDIHTDAEANEQADWLVEAAREFYLAKNDGAAG